MKFYDGLEYFNRPAKPEFMAGQIARLRVSIPRRAEDNQDIELLVDVMVEDCREYSADVIRYVVQNWRLHNRFFPIPKDFRQKLDEAMAFRRAILAVLSGKTEPDVIGASRSKTNRRRSDVGFPFWGLLSCAGRDCAVYFPKSRG